MHGEYLGQGNVGIRNSFVYEVSEKCINIHPITHLNFGFKS